MKKGDKKGYNVMDLARYIINYAYKYDYQIDRHKLQKVLYQLQGRSYRYRDKELFDDNIVYMRKGPHIPTIEKTFSTIKYKDLPPYNDLQELQTTDKDENQEFKEKEGLYDNIPTEVQDFLNEHLPTLLVYDDLALLIRCKGTTGAWDSGLPIQEHDIIDKEYIQKWFNPRFRNKGK